MANNVVILSQQKKVKMYIRLLVTKKIKKIGDFGILVKYSYFTFVYSTPVQF